MDRHHLRTAAMLYELRKAVLEGESRPRELPIEAYLPVMVDASEPRYEAMFASTPIVAS